MSATTFRLPDDKHARLKTLARQRGTSVSRSMEEMATPMRVEFAVETRFALRAARAHGKSARGRVLLEQTAGRSA